MIENFSDLWVQGKITSYSWDNYREYRLSQSNINRHLKERKSIIYLPFKVRNFIVVVANQWPY